MNELIGKQSVWKMVLAYNAATNNVNDAYDSMKEARDEMSLAFGSKELWSTLNLMTDKRTQVLTELKVAAWKYVIEQPDVKSVMTEKRTLELKAQFNGELPDFTFESVESILASLRGDVGTMMTESVKEVFEWLRPHKNKYKTNTEFEVGNKAILEFIFHVWKGPTWHDLHFEEDSKVLSSLDNVFHLLDGKGVAKYPKDLRTVVKQVHAEKGMSCETEYFKCKWYKKGSFHIQFKRMDLVDELNRIAGGNRLKEAQAI